MIAGNGLTLGEEAIAHALLANAYATMAVFGQLAQLRTSTDERLKDVASYIDAVATAIRTHDI